ncbi:hypothetical protein [Bacillus paranthracis]|uniref:hypothetical protein n=1 Tax=Bacillus paranthracis TaxID=2026186 RepID=UPI0001A15CCE|nr:NADH dehydrogenase subunit 5 [Bacillus cereus AH1273]
MSMLDKMKDAEEKNKETESFKSGAVEQLKKINQKGKKSKPGRKKKNGMNKTYYLDVDVVGMLSEEAGEMGVSDSVFIEMLVKKYVKEKE